MNVLIPINTKVCVNSLSLPPSHIGRLVAYFTATGVYDSGTELYGVILLDKPYWTENHDTCISMLTVHISNLEVYRDPS